MLSLVEVQCPHCEVRGQIMVPPLGGIIFGPCPQCDEPVVIFCGKALPLDKATMLEGDIEDRREHMLEVLSEFLNQRLGEMLSQSQQEPAEDESDGGDDTLDSASLEQEETEEAEEAVPENPITQTEFDRFTEVDLDLLDDADYFKSVFEAS